MEKSNQINQINNRPLEYGVHPFTHIISAKIGSGKTYYLMDLIKTHYLNYFQKIYVFCPTVNLDEKWQELSTLNSNKKLLKKSGDDYQEGLYVVYDNEDEYNQKLSELYQEYIHYDMIYNEDIGIYQPIGDSVNQPLKTLIIFDDCSGIKEITHGNIIQKLIRKSRHLNISIIYAIQDIRGVAPSIRNNTRLLTLFKCFNEEELTKVYEAFTLPCSKKIFINTLFKIFKYYDENKTDLDRPIIVFNNQNKLIKHLVILLKHGFINF